MKKYKKQLSGLLAFIIVVCLVTVPKINVSAHAWDGIVSQDSDYYYYDGHYYEYCYNYSDANGAADIQGVTYEHQYANFNISQPRPARYLWSKDDVNGDRCIGGGTYLAKDYGFDCYANYWDGDVFATVPSSWFYQNGITYMKKAHAYYKRLKTIPSHKSYGFTNTPYNDGVAYWVKPNTQFGISVTGTQAFPGTQLQLDDHVKYNCLRLQSATTEMRAAGKDDGACNVYQPSSDLLVGVVSYNKGNYYRSFACDMTTQFGVTAYNDNQDYDVYDYIESYNGKNSPSWVSLGKVKTDGTAPVAENINLTNTTENSTTINVNSVTDNNRSGVKSVSLQVWTSLDKSDLETLTSYKSGDGTYSYTLNFSKHGGKSKTYNMIAVMTDNVGNVGQISKSTFLTSTNSIETQYIDEDTNMSISSSDVQTVEDGSYNVTPKTINGYSLAKYKDENGNIADYSSSNTYSVSVSNGQNKTVYFIYKKLLNTPPTSTLIVDKNVAYVGDTVNLTGVGTDKEDTADKLTYSLNLDSNISGYTDTLSNTYGSIPGGVGGTITFTKEGTYTFSLKTTDTGNPSGTKMSSDVATATIKVMTRGKPIAVINAPSTLYVGDTGTIDGLKSQIAMAGDTITDYTWTVTPSTGITPNSITGSKQDIKFNSEGTYNLTLVITDNHGVKSDVASATIKVITRGKPIAVINAPSTLYVGDTGTIDGLKSQIAMAGDIITDYTWTITPTTGITPSSITGSKQDTKFTAEGTYNLTLVVTDNHGVKSDVASATIKVITKEPDTGTLIKRYYKDSVEQTSDRATTTENVGSIITYSNKYYDGYTCNETSKTVTITANNTTYADFYFTKNVQTLPPVAHINAPTEVHSGVPVYVTGYGTDPQGLKITNYEWTSSTGETITGTGGTINLTGDSATVTLKVENEKGIWSDTVTAIIGAVNHPPTVYLQTPSTVMMGDDVAVNAYGSDIDGDPIYYIWNNPSDFLGSCSGTSGMGYFNNIGYKYFTVTAYDPFGARASASSSVNVIAPIPNVVITKAGTDKENRKITLDAGQFSYGGSKKFPIDWTTAKWEFFDSSGNKVAVDNNATSDTLIKSLDNTNGTKGIDLIIKQQGKYKVRCTVTNTAGYTNYADINLNISPDIVPIADFDLPGTGIRDSSDLSPHGLAQATTILADNCSSRDDDVIAKRMWVGAWDSDNDGSYIWVTKNEDGTTKTTPTYERWYVYDLDYNGSTDTQQNGLSDSLNPHWRYVGNYNDAKALDINSINCGNLVSVQFKSTSVGNYDFEETVKEDFGQETIPELVTNNDRKQATTWGTIN